MIRRLFAAGQASGRSPEALVPLAMGMQFFDDKDFAASASTFLSEAFKDEAKTFVKRASTALGGTKVGEIDLFKGTEDASRFERLQILRDAGLRTMTDLQGAGFTEFREQQALKVLLSDKTFNELGPRQQFIQNKLADPNYLEGLINLTQDKSILIQAGRVGRQTEAMFEDTRAGLTSDQSELQAARKELRDAEALAAGTALTETGNETAALGMFRLVDETGRITPRGRQILWLEQHWPRMPYEKQYYQDVFRRQEELRGELGIDALQQRIEQMSNPTPKTGAPLLTDAAAQPYYDNTRPLPNGIGSN